MMDRDQWDTMGSAPRTGTPILLLFGETIPEVPDIRVGTFIDGDSAEKCGYREFAKYGGWLIWNSGSDFYVVDVSEPRAWSETPMDLAP